MRTTADPNRSPDRDVVSTTAPTDVAISDVAIIVPIYNEATTLPRLIRHLRSLHPAPAEIIVVDAGSSDGSVQVAQAAGLQVIAHDVKRRSAQINRGVAEARAAHICVLHADTYLPDDAMLVISAVLADPQIALAGFTSVMSGHQKVRWATTFHNWIKTWYAPALFHPILFARRGLRLLFGDHAMFFRRRDFEQVGGFDCEITVMEEGDLCLKMCRLGRIHLVNRIVISSDRRVAESGELRANLVYLKVGLLWGLGVRGERLTRYYPDVR